MGTWIIEVGVDINGTREYVLEVDAGPKYGLARLTLENLKGMTVGDVISLDLDYEEVSTEGSWTDLVAGASLVFYDGEETITDTYEHVDFM